MSHPASHFWGFELKFDLHPNDPSNMKNLSTGQLSTRLKAQGKAQVDTTDVLCLFFLMLELTSPFVPFKDGYRRQNTYTKMVCKIFKKLCRRSRVFGVQIGRSYHPETWPPYVPRPEWDPHTPNVAVPESSEGSLPVDLWPWWSFTLSCIQASKTLQRFQFVMVMFQTKCIISFTSY